MKKMLVALLLLAGAIVPACPLSAQSAEDCASLKAKRENAFFMHLSYLKRVRSARSELAAMNTVDPAVIDTRFKQFSAAIKNLREKRQRLTPDEEKLTAYLFEAYEDGYSFWQAKKAREDTGGIVDVPTAKKYRAFLQASLKSSEAMERSYSAEIDTLDRESAQCKATQSSAASKSRYHWAGTYVSGPYVIEISGGGDEISYTAKRNDPDTTDDVKGKCTVEGAVATCKESGTYKDSDKKVERDSTTTLTLSGNTISAKSKVTKSTVTRADGQPCPDPAQCTGLHVGAEFSGTWTRKP